MIGNRVWSISILDTLSKLKETKVHWRPGASQVLLATEREEGEGGVHVGGRRIRFRNRVLDLVKNAIAFEQMREGFEVVRQPMRPYILSER